ncbi:hypothetical protein CI109_100802 [Kwoniella shandongensis]|uniref:RlpA-like protein double-psi beta-barrel domain-containing protein n=1 Tax=Kwoniella shandongensis TaxID=1734106 RepID=A0A5M6C087_9TREE|nr:uncharacterized protein CI109_005019 [Kwoniella shandongensis]KAA5526629.1 hypothetical protein CI109_005019 [Kwoniella shandongensis]
MLSLLVLVQLLPLLAFASHLPPHKRHSTHERARKNFEHVHGSDNTERELVEREHHFDNRTLVERDSYTGVGTFYYTGLGACGQYSHDNDFMVAMNSAQYGGGYPGPQCFKYISIQVDSKVVSGIQVLDECPTCDYGSLDLSPGLFTQFAGQDAGTVHLTWWFDGEQPQQTSTTPTSTYTPPTSTWVAPTTTSTSEWVAPSSSTSQWVAPSTQSSAIPSSTSQWSQPAATDSSTSTSTSSAASSTITSSPLSSTIAANSTNPFAVIQTDNSTTTATLPLADNSTSVTGTSSNGTASGGHGGVSAQIAVEANNLASFNGLVAQYGQLVVEAAGGRA